MLGTARKGGASKSKVSNFPSLYRKRSQNLKLPVGPQTAERQSPLTELVRINFLTTASAHQFQFPALLLQLSFVIARGYNGGEGEKGGGEGGLA